MIFVISFVIKSYDNESYDKVKNYWDFIIINIKNFFLELEFYNIFNIIFLFFYNIKVVFVVFLGEIY